MEHTCVNYMCTVPLQIGLSVSKSCSAPAQAMKDGFQNAGRQGVAVYLPPGGVECQIATRALWSAVHLSTSHWLTAAAAGTYVVTKMIEITQSNVVLRGAGVSVCVCVWPSCCGCCLFGLCASNCVPVVCIASAGGPDHALLPEGPQGSLWQSNGL